MNHWRKPHYTIETEHGTLHSVTDDDAELAAYEFTREPYPVKFTIRRERHRVSGYLYIPGMAFLIFVIIVGIRYFFEG